MLAPVVVEEVVVVEAPTDLVVNNIAPFYVSPPPMQVEIQKTSDPSSWSLTLPDPVDPEEATVTVSVSKGAAGSFLQFASNTLSIPDLSDTGVLDGIFPLTVTLDDGKVKTSYSIELTIVPLEEEEVLEEGAASAEGEDGAAPGDGDLSEADTADSAATSEEAAKAEEKKAIAASVNNFKADLLARLSKIKRKKAKGKKNSAEIVVDEIEEDEPEPPVPSIKKIHQKGLVEIVFSAPVFTVPNLTMITNGTTIIREKPYPVLEVRILPGIDSDPSKHKFWWEAVAQTSTTLDLQMVFEDAKFISANADKETLDITFWDEFLFMSEEGLVIEEKKRTIRREMPPQLSANDAEVQSAIDSASNSAKGVMAANFLISLILSASLN